MAMTALVCKARTASPLSRCLATMGHELVFEIIGMIESRWHRVRARRRRLPGPWDGSCPSAGKDPSRGLPLPIPVRLARCETEQTSCRAVIQDARRPSVPVPRLSVPGSHRRSAAARTERCRDQLWLSSRGLCAVCSYRAGRSRSWTHTNSRWFRAA